MAIVKELISLGAATITGKTRSSSFEGDGLLAGTAGNRSNSYAWNTNGGRTTIPTNTNLLTNGAGFLTAPMTSITYSSLKSLRDNSLLIPGMLYRITDYTCTTTQANTQSAGHVFDIIVVADSANTLNENARAMLHSGDTYFANSDLAAWQLKYDLNNDTIKYAWADTTNGKGVIYWMKDEANNECGYDFKNIQFEPDQTFKLHVMYGSSYYCKYKRSINSSGYWQYNLIERNSGPWSNPPSSVFVTDDIITSSTTIWIYDGNTYQLLSISGLTIFEINNSELIYTFSCKINGIKIDALMSPIRKDACYSNIIEFKKSLPFNYFNTDDQYLICYNNILKSNCFSNTFKSNCYNNILEFNCYSNTFETGCHDNILKSNCYTNWFYSDCCFNIFGSGCHDNKINSTCNNNILGLNCYLNTFYSGCNNNVFGNNCYSNTINSNCLYNTFDSYCYSNILNSSCNNNTFGSDFRSNILGSSCNNNTFGNNCESNALDNECTCNIFNNGCMSNRLGLFCSYNLFGEHCLLVQFCDYQGLRKSYYKYIIIESGNSYIRLNCTGTTSLNTPYLNVTISQGVNTDKDPYNIKLINDSNTGQTYQTIYQPANSKVISV